MSGPIDEQYKARAAKVLPSGAFGHLSTRLLPDGFPQFIEKAAGAYIWDNDGNRYIDYLCAYGPNLFGYGEPTILAAAKAQLDVGDVMTGPSKQSVELAEKMTSMVTHADWAFFCKNGTDATTMARTIARAHTNKKTILVAHDAYHGAAPWCTPVPVGTVPEDRAHMIEYDYNDLASLDAAVEKAGDDLAAIFATPFKHEVFQDQLLLNAGYAKRCREHCDRLGAALVVDDVRAGFRLAKDCSWQLVDVQPDISTWGKSLANGHPLSVVLGSDKFRMGADNIFATGSFWHGAVPVAAALATMELIEKSDYIERSVELGGRLRVGLDEKAAAHGFVLRQTGPVQMPQIFFENDPDFKLGLAWTEAMLKHGVYMHPWHNMFLCAAMTVEDIDATIQAADKAFAEIKPQVESLTPHPMIMMMLAMKQAQEAEAA